MKVKDLGTQISMIWNITVSPRKTFPTIPSDRLLPFAFFISYYFSFARIMRQGLFSRMSSELNSSLITFVIMLIIGFFVYYLTGVILRLLILLLGKRLSTSKVLNIIGYSQSPRLFMSVPLSILLALLPEELLIKIIGSSSDLFGIILTLIGAPFLIYSIVLLVWGLIVSPNEQLSDQETDAA